MSTVAEILRCPIDRTSLTPVETPDGESFICSSCGGRWTESQIAATVGATEGRFTGESTLGDTTRIESVQDRMARRLRGDSEEFVRAAARQSIYGISPKPIVARVQPVQPARTSDAARLTYRDVPAKGTAATTIRPPVGRSVQPIEMFYDTIAERFDAIMNHYDLRRRVETVFDVLLKAYDLRNLSLLDAGCGTGWFSAEACKRGANVTALDIGPRLLEQVRRKCNAKTVVGDVLNLRFPDATFDVVVSSECIEHTTDPRGAVRELLRVCKPGGLAVITCPNRRWHWACVVANRLRLRPYEGLENWPRWRELQAWIRETGAEILSARGIHLFPFQFPPLRPVLRMLDDIGDFIGPWCVNQAVLATKPC